MGDDKNGDKRIKAGTHPEFMVKVREHAESLNVDGCGSPSSLWDHDYIKRLCKSLGEPKLCERWVQIKNWLYDNNLIYDDEVGVPPVDPRPPEWLVIELRVMWGMLSNAFDHCLYKPGKRRTAKDNRYASDHPLARHNFLHSGYVIALMLRWCGMYDAVRGDFYFPNIKTKTVRQKTKRRFSILLDYLGWTFERGPY